MIYTLDSSAGIWLQKLRLKASDITKPRGWWGHELETRFKMDNKWKGSGGIKDRYKNLLQLKLILNHCNNLTRVDNHVTRSSGVKSVAGVTIGRFRSYRLQNTWGKLLKTSSSLLQFCAQTWGFWATQNNLFKEFRLCNPPPVLSAPLYASLKGYYTNI